MPSYAVSAVNTTTNVLTATGVAPLMDALNMNPSLLTGDRIRLRNYGGVLPASTPALSQLVDYWAIRVSTDEIKVAVSQADALNGIAVDLTGSGTGTTYIEYQLPFALPTQLSAKGAQVHAVDLNTERSALVAWYEALNGKAQTIFPLAVPSKRAFFPNQINIGVGGSVAWTPAANPAQAGSALTAVLKAGAGYSGTANLFSVPYVIGERPVALSAWIYGDGTSSAGVLTVRMGYAPDPTTLPVNLGIATYNSLPVGWSLYSVTNTVQVIPDGGMLTADLVFAGASANVYLAEFFLSVEHPHA